MGTSRWYAQLIERGRVRVRVWPWESELMSQR
jgi:hypothetical protein